MGTYWRGSAVYTPALSTVLTNEIEITFTVDISSLVTGNNYGDFDYLVICDEFEQGYGYGLTGEAFTGANKTGASKTVSLDFYKITDKKASLTCTLPKGTKSFSLVDGVHLHEGNSIDPVRVVLPWGQAYPGAQSNRDYYSSRERVEGCASPSTVSVDVNNVAPGAKVLLSWRDAEAGWNNNISGYEIYRASASPDGPYSLLNKVSATATGGSYTVTAPTTSGVTYYYKVKTLGSVSGYDSEVSDDYAELTCNFAAVTAPLSVSLAATNAAPGAEVLLSWSGATAGDNNAITGYEVHRSGSANSGYSLLATVTATETEGSYTVTAPVSNLETYYYKIKTLGTLDDCDSDLSKYAALTCTYSSPAAPLTATINGKASVYALPGTDLELAWSGAASGANNPITGYTITRDGDILVEGLAATVNSYTVEANATAGEAYSFAIITKGQFADSAPSAACVAYSYTDPAAPSSLAVAEAVPTVGGRTTLSWSGAEAGGYNEITGYRVHRSATENGTYGLYLEIVSTDTAASCFVDAPNQVGSYYYYKVETVGAYSLSGLSAASVSVGAAEATGEGGSVDVIVPPHKRRSKRRFVFGDYDTALDGKWTLTGWSFPEPEAQTNFVEVPGRVAGPLDLSTYLTGGDPRYNSREFTATFESSEGSRAQRDAIIEDMINSLHGARVNIEFPDDGTRYATGRLHVEKEYSDPAHAAIVVTAVCEPWRYAKDETQVSLTASEDTKTVVLFNGGRRVLVPVVHVSGYGASVYLACGGLAWTLAAGEYRLPDLVLPRGNTVLTCYGSGIVRFAYREAVL